MVVSTHKGRTTVSTFLLTVHNMQKQHEFPLVPPSFPGLTTSHDNKTGPSPCWANATVLHLPYLHTLFPESWAHPGSGGYLSLSVSPLPYAFISELHLPKGRNIPSP